MGRNYGVKPPPRVVIHAPGNLADLRSAAEAHANDMRESAEEPIRWADWNVLITTGGVAPDGGAGALRVIQFGGNPIGLLQHEHFSNQFPVGLRTTVGSTVHEPDGLSDEQSALIKQLVDTCIELGEAEQTVLHRTFPGQSGTWQPLLVTADSDPIAAIYKPVYGASEVWYFPRESIKIAEVVCQVAFTQWHREAPDIFPSAPNWTSNQRWMTAGQQVKFGELSRRIEDSKTRIASAEREIADAEAAIEGVRRDASTSEQRLLTADGDELVSAVTAALTELKFEVVDLDADTPEGKPKIGDLEVSHPDFPDWKIMAEVKGKTKGAALNDLFALQTHRRVYEQTRPTLSGVWYLVNAERRKPDPGSRPVPLESATDEIDTFAEDHGLVIDTRDLFQLVKSVQLQLISERVAAEALIEQYGRFKLPVGQTPNV
ncbi:hypothetical protein [Rhodococcus sp. NPDC006774]|uniref:hypothetical protein n=1 Tax=Rhodococcus sp. NPDC006774 TaxID=3157186 RepID=UPI0033DEFE51